MTISLKPENLDPDKPVAVIDIGSNSIRLVIFEKIERSPQEAFNEKQTCALGAGLSADGTSRLAADGKRLALQTLRRFAHILAHWEPSIPRANIIALATEALRKAEDGPAFATEILRKTGIPVEIISGVTEGRLSALGVLSGIPDADGIVGDLGGGSLELVDLRRFRTHRFHDPNGTSLPLGALRVQEIAAQGGSKAADDYIRAHLSSGIWRPSTPVKSFICVGGNWRKICKLYQQKHKQPILSTHKTTIKTTSMLKFLRATEKASPRLLTKRKGIGDRAATLPAAARVLRHVLETIKPEQVVFSEYGLREGLISLQLSPAQRQTDPLLYEASHKFSGDKPTRMSEYLVRWIAPLKLSGGLVTPSMIAAVCLMSDRVAKRDHQDSQGRHAYNNILGHRFAGCSTEQRAFMALAMFARYEGGIDHPKTEDARRILAPHDRAKALTLGMALKTAYALAGHSATILKGTRLAFDGVTLTLHRPTRLDPPTGGKIDRYLTKLQKAIALVYKPERPQRSQPLSRAPKS